MSRRTRTAVAASIGTLLTLARPSRAAAQSDTDDLDYLPLWRWAGADFRHDFTYTNTDNIGALIGLFVSSVIFTPISVLWRVLAAVVRFGVSADFITDASVINNGYADSAALLGFGTTTSSALLGLAVGVIFTIVVWRAIRSGKLTLIIRPLIMLSLASVLYQGAITDAPYGPGNIVVELDDVTAQAGGQISSSFVSSFGIDPAAPDKINAQHAPHCDAYLAELYTTYLRVNAGNSERSMGRFFSAQVSMLWEGSYMEAWKIVQLGSNEISDRVFCRLMDHQAGADPAQSAQLTNRSYTRELPGGIRRTINIAEPGLVARSDGTPGSLTILQSSPFGPFYFDTADELEAAMLGFAACDYDRGLVAPFHSAELKDNNGDTINNDACARFYRSDTEVLDAENAITSLAIANGTADPTEATSIVRVPWRDQTSAFEVAGPFRIKGSEEYRHYAGAAANSDATQELNDFFDGLTGRRLMIASGLGLVVLITLIAYVRVLGGIIVGLIFGQLILIGVGILLPILLLIMAMPTDLGRKSTKAIGTMVLGGLFAKVISVLLLGLLIALSNAFTAAFEPTAQDAGWLTRMLLLSAGPLTGMYFGRFLLKRLGFKDVLTFNGSLNAVSNFTAGAVAGAGAGALVSGLTTQSLRRQMRNYRMASATGRRAMNTGRKLIPGTDTPNRTSSGGARRRPSLGGYAPATTGTSPAARSGFESGVSLKGLRRAKTAERKAARATLGLDEGKDRVLGHVLDADRGGAIRAELGFAQRQAKKAATATAVAGALATTGVGAPLAVPVAAYAALKGSSAARRVGGAAISAANHGTLDTSGRQNPDQPRSRQRPGRDRTADPARAARNRRRQELDAERQHRDSAVTNPARQPLPPPTTPAVPAPAPTPTAPTDKPAHPTPQPEPMPPRLPAQPTVGTQPLPPPAVRATLPPPLAPPRPLAAPTPLPPPDRAPRRPSRPPTGQRAPRRPGPGLPPPTARSRPR